MTSLAFILGVLPLVISSGAGAGARHSVGTGVMGGMLAATFLAIFFVPFFFKLIMERRFGEKRGQGVGIAITESDIATRAGLARETVSRGISKLKQEGLISVIKNEIFIDDLDKLADTLGREL